MMSHRVPASGTGADIAPVITIRTPHELFNASSGMTPVRPARGTWTNLLVLTFHEMLQADSNQANPMSIKMGPPSWLLGSPE